MLVYAIEVYLNGTLQGYIYDVNELSFTFQVTPRVEDCLEYGYRVGLEVLDALRGMWGSSGYDFVLLRL